MEKDATKSQNMMWESAMVGAKDERTAIMAAYFSAVNSVVDTYAIRLAALRNNVPESVYLTIVTVAFFGLFALGCSQSVNSQVAHSGIKYFSVVMIALFISIILVQIMDLDRQRRGIVQISQQPMIDLISKWHQ